MPCRTQQSKSGQLLLSCWLERCHWLWKAAGLDWGLPGVRWPCWDSGKQLKLRGGLVSDPGLLKKAAMVEEPSGFSRAAWGNVPLPFPGFSWLLMGASVGSERIQVLSRSAFSVLAH